MTASGRTVRMSALRDRPLPDCGLLRGEVLPQPQCP